MVRRNPYIVIEITEAEWETLFELDRLEYNNTHKYQRHTDSFSDKDEEELSPKKQQRRINKDIPFNVLVNEQVDREITLRNLPNQYREILKAILEDKTQKEVAEELGVTQGYISSVFKKADCSIDDYVSKQATVRISSGIVGISF